MTESVAIVTGASQGIGRATAVRLAKDFSGVALAARDRDALEARARLLKFSHSDEPGVGLLGTSLPLTP